MMRRGGILLGALLSAVLFGPGAGRAGSHGSASHDSAGKSGGKPQVMLLLSAPSQDEASRGRLLHHVLRGLRGKKVTADPIDVSNAQPGDRWPQLDRCSDSECQAELCQKSELRQLFSLRIVRDGDDYQVSGQIYDAAMADFASAVETTCVSCDGDQLAARLVTLTGELVHKAHMRKTGLLEITSMPPGATVRLNGMRLGQTPLTVTTFAGEHRIEVVKPGFVRYQLDVVVEPGRGAAHDANLVIEPGVPQSGDQPQPRRASVGQSEAFGQAVLASQP
ncbi:MAG TPA: PEGA domain-containing protein [Pseudomonadota bacterium]|nr:PEGA domain-containing protein [Pseudomonadota bacterium]